MLTTGPLVSVLMTSYNRERYIAEAIESVLAQTFEDFELVIVDDASTDGSVAIARAYARRDSRIRVLTNAHNRGDYPNRNYAASLAHGRFIKYHDSDDVMYSHCLEVMVSMVLAEPRAAFGVSIGSAWPGGPCPMLLTPRLAYQREFFGNGMFNGGPASALFRTEAFRELGGFPEQGTHSDTIFWLSACARVNCVLLPADLFWYRIHDEQQWQTAAGAREALPLFQIVWRQIGAPSCPLTDAEREVARVNLVYRLIAKSARDLRAGQWALALDRLRAADLSIREWATYLRRPRRDVLAGTPRTADGEYVVPSPQSARVSVQP